MGRRSLGCGRAPLVGWTAEDGTHCTFRSESSERGGPSTKTADKTRRSHPARRRSSLTRSRPRGSQGLAPGPLAGWWGALVDRASAGAAGLCCSCSWEGCCDGRRFSLRCIGGDLFLVRWGPLASGVEGGVSNQAHEPDVASAIDEGNLALGEQPSQIPRSPTKCRIETRARPAEDTD